MDLTVQNTIAWHDRNTSQHKALVDEWAGKGFRTLSLSVYGSPQDPRFAAVMVKRPVVQAESQFGPTNQAGIQKAFDDMAKQGRGPYILTATGPAGSAQFAGSFTPMSQIPLTRLNLTGPQFTKLNNEQLAAGNILVWADAFGTPQDTRYTAIWGPNPTRVASNVEAIDEGGATLQARFDAMTSMWSRPAHLSVTPSGRLLEQFVDSTIGPWSSRVGLTSADYQALFDAESAAGRMPLRVSASGTGSATRFAAIFVDRDHADARTFRKSGPTTVSAIDAAMEAFMKDADIRGASLAITRGTQLVYAKGYTNAEPAGIYPDVQPTTLFRQASVSKVFAAVAMYRLMQLQPNITLNTTMQSVLHLTQPDGSAPKDSRFKDIKLRHLLESTSGLPQGAIWQVEQAAKAFNKPLPATPAQLASYGASLTTMAAPGTKTNVVYGNFDYFLLSQVVAKLAGAGSFEAALQTLVLAPLGMTRTRGSRSLVGSQAADEARHHVRTFDGNGLWPLRTDPSLRSAAKPTVPTQYGGWDSEMLDGCGGLSSAAVDVARIVAMLSDHTGNPLLSTASIDAMLQNAATATSTLSGPDAHGYHGFDWGFAYDVQNHVYRAAKGGWLAGTQTEVYFTTGGFGIVMLRNGNDRPGSKTEWYKPVLKAAVAHDWPSTDLFPGFGMPALDPQMVPLPFKEQLVPSNALQLVQASIARDLEAARRPAAIKVPAR